MSSANSMWMVRAGRGGEMAADFVEKRVVAIGWGDAGDLSQLRDRAAILARIKEVWPEWKRGRQISSAGQLARFAFEVRKGDRVVTYDSSSRMYHVGTVVGDFAYKPDVTPPYGNVRSVQWEGVVDRDKLSVPAKNSLGSALTLFRTPDQARKEIEGALAGQPVAPRPDEPEVEDEAELLEDVEAKALEFIKDRVSALDWEEMQLLVAGLLRAMGYKTKISAVGPDRGRDIVASPDGFGFENPRIVVEVKHRSQAMGSQEIRGFLGGRHKDDKGLYVSTGGFSKDARYEADRATIPLTLMDIDDLVLAVVEYYDRMDIETQRLLPLRRIYWPA